MAIQQARITVTGFAPLLMNNPQTVDPFNKYTKLKKAITNKKAGKTEDDLIELGNLETEGKLFFDDEVGVYVPTRWLTEAIVMAGYTTAKIGKDKMRGGLFSTEGKAKLFYRDMDKVKTITDIIMNPVFRNRMLLPQKGVRVAKDFPMYHDWSFSTILEYDDSVVDFNGLKAITERTAKYTGFGDFRPTFGRSTAEVTSV